MSSVVETFRGILLLRRGPQDLPYSTQLLIALAAAYIVVQSFAQTIPTPVSLGQSLAATALATGLIVSALRLALRMRQLGNRFVQSAAALLGANLIFALINLPLTIAFGRYPIDDAGRIDTTQITSTQLMLTPVVLVLGIWQLVVVGSVLRHSLNLSLGAGIALIFGWLAALSLLLGLAGVQG